jgi:jumonji domain-containing protein 7
VRGEKRFTLLPPSDGWCLKGVPLSIISTRPATNQQSPVYGMIERLYPHATYHKSLSSSNTFEIVPSQDVPPVRWSSIPDPTLPNALPEGITPIQVCLRPGEALYLPAGWWHYVQQAQETTIAINWWYDMEMRGIHWVFLNLLRNTKGLYVDGDDEEGDETSDEHSRIE